jgi:AraC-like DNA-binding protein
MSSTEALERLPMPMGYFRLILRCFGNTPKRRAAILYDTGVTEADLSDPAADISLFQQVCQFGNLNTLLGEGWVLTAEDLWFPTSHGALGVAAITAPNLSGSLADIAEYGRTRAPHVLHVLHRGTSETRLEYDVAVPLEEPLWRALIEASFMSVRAVVVTVLGRMPDSVHYRFACREPAYSDLVRRALGGVVNYGAEGDSVTLPSAGLDELSPLQDKALHTRAIEELKVELQRLSQPLELRVRLGRLLHTMPDGRLSVATAARALGVSRRTLERRLAATGSGYRQVLDDELKERAGRLMESGALSQAEIADRLGFKDPTSLSRAFRRWFGAGGGAAKFRPRPLVG